MGYLGGVVGKGEAGGRWLPFQHADSFYGRTGGITQAAINHRLQTVIVQALQSETRGFPVFRRTVSGHWATTR